MSLAMTAGGEAPIYLFEICAAILTACVAVESSLETTRPCVLCIDNQAALAALIKGSASLELVTVLVGVFWAIAARSPAQWWLEYVHTDSDDADAPSRDCNAAGVRTCSLSSGTSPLDFAKTFESWGSMHRASTRL